MGWRIIMFGRRLADFVCRWPWMLMRWIKWLLWIESPKGRHRIPRWLAGMFMLSFDLALLGLWYETLMDIIKWRSRPMRQDEIDNVRSVYGENLPYRLITLDDRSWLVKKGITMAYVSFHTVHFYKTIPDPTLVHELMHIWQYQKQGSLYITEALYAQKWGGGYNYGGHEPLLRYSAGEGLRAFNVEQQADIIEEYFRWKHGLPLQWVANVPGIGQVLESYAEQLGESFALHEAQKKSHRPPP